MRRWLWAALFLGLFGTSGAQEGPCPLEAGRGVNLSGIFAQSPRDPRVWEERLAKVPPDRLRAQGFRVVRLPVDPEALWDGQGRLLPDRIDRVLEAVERYVRGGLAVVLDLHPYPHLVAEILRGGGAAGRHRRLLGVLAQRLGALPSDRVVLEPLNEPFDVAPKDWDRFQEDLVRGVRREAPGLWVVLAGARWGSLEGLLEMTPPPLPRLAASFHHYEPHVFTHQGATWGPGVWRDLVGIPYPPRPGTGPSSPEARVLLGPYEARSWGPEERRGLLRQAREWSDRTGVPVWCGEFGVIDGAPTDSRARWLQEVRTVLEGLGIPWCLWDHSGTFGVFSRPPEERRVLLRALGLPEPPRIADGPR